MRAMSMLVGIAAVAALSLTLVHAAVVSYDFYILEGTMDFRSPANVAYGQFVLPVKEQILAYFINNVYPAPTIWANEGDTIRVNFTNYFWEVGDSSIHWHGLHQRGTPFMDGVPGVTQCQVGKFESFIYEFVAYPPGTRLYHSHTSDQTEHGMVGALIIQAADDQNAALYTSEQVALITDMYEDPVNYGISFAGQGRTYVNGVRGENVSYSGGLYPFPLFNVTSGQCTRVRFIFGGGESHGFIVRFAHPITIIAVDGNDIEHVPNQSGFIFTAGERVDALICGTQTAGNYPVIIESTASSIANHPPSYAFVHYVGQPLPQSEGVGTGGGASAHFQPQMAAWFYNNGWSDFRLASYKTGPPTGVADQVITLTAAYAKNSPLPDGYNWHGFTLAPDRWPGVMSDTPYLHTRGLNQKCIPKHSNMYTVWNESTVDIIVNNIMDPPLDANGGVAHPIHLHGYDFWVLGTGHHIDQGIVTNDPLQYYDNTNITRRQINCGHALDETNNCNYMDSVDRAKLNFVNPPLKDTVTVAPANWVYLRIRADNPGVWFIHCHIGGHMNVGMTAVINVMPYSQPELPANTKYCGLCRPDYAKVMGITTHCETCTTTTCPTTTCPSTTCPSTSCSSGSSSCNSGGNTNSVANTVNVNFANMFNGLNLH